MSVPTESSDNGTEQGWISLKNRIRNHYDLCSVYYNSLWGEHIHHGYWPADKLDLSKEAAQVNLIELLLSRSKLEPNVRVLDVGCGLGGTSRYLARERCCDVTGISISSEQVKMATQMSKGLLADESPASTATKQGSVQFVELDAEKMADYFQEAKQPGFDAVWISEALSHFPNKQLFFNNAAQALRQGKVSGGKLVLADWFKNENLSQEEFNKDVRPIEHGMLLPPLCTQSEYVAFAKAAGFKVYAEPLDISQEVSKTWDISIGLVASPSLWALAFTQGKDFVAFLRAFTAMRNGYRNGSFRYAVMVFEL